MKKEVHKHFGKIETEKETEDAFDENKDAEKKKKKE